jgi:hypothetical protein
MKRLSLIIGIVALALTIAAPARADFSLIKLPDGHCEIWFAGFEPWRVGWLLLRICPDWWSAQVARDFAIANGVCIL